MPKMPDDMPRSPSAEEMRVYVRRAHRERSAAFATLGASFVALVRKAVHGPSFKVPSHPVTSARA